MRGTILLLAFAAVACGSKPAKDPSESTPPPDDIPKWEGASHEAPKPATTAHSPGVQEAPARRTDVYDKEQTEIELKRSARQVKQNCGAAKDDNGKATGPWGKTTIQVQLGHNGHSKGVVVPAPYQGKPTGNCVEKAFTNLTFPPWGGADTQVDWEIELVQPK